MFFRIAITLAVLASSATQVDAQRRGMAGQQADSASNMGMMQGMMGGGMMGSGMMEGGMMQMMGQGMGLMPTGGPGPAVILEMRDSLGLSEEQVGQLEEIRDRHHTAHSQMGDGPMGAHSRAKEAITGDNPDFQAYESALRDMADSMVQMHVGMARSAAEAREVLTAEQQEMLTQIGQGMMRGMRMGPG